MIKKYYNRSHTFYLVCLLSLCTVQLYSQHQKNFVAVTCSRNNAKWCERNLTSIFTQQYDNWHLIYINDNSSDKTQQLTEQLIDKYNMHDKVTMINNSERRGHLYNQYHAIHTVPDDHIITIIDGDDWLAHDQVFSYLNDVYQDPSVWLTYGQFKFYPKGSVGIAQPVSQKEMREKSFRNMSWRFTHIRTFYAGLFKCINKEDLMHENTFFPAAADCATMYPMLEMCGDRFKFIRDVLYIYNLDPGSIHCDWGAQGKFHGIIKKKNKYPTIIDSPSWLNSKSTLTSK